jgi:hypothetical protein
MNDAMLIAIPLVAMFTCGCVCIGFISCVRDASRTLTIEIHNPVIVVQASGSPDADEDPVDFSSNPKSSSVSVGS